MIDEISWCDDVPAQVNAVKHKSDKVKTAVSADKIIDVVISGYKSKIPVKFQKTADDYVDECINQCIDKVHNIIIDDEDGFNLTLDDLSVDINCSFINVSGDEEIGDICATYILFSALKQLKKLGYMIDMTNGTSQGYASEYKLFVEFIINVF